MAPIIELKNVKKTYRIGEDIPVPALDDVSIKIEAGEFVAITGASGSGKSTMLAILGLLDGADSGNFLLLGKDITRMSENEFAELRNRFFGFIFQQFNLLPRLNVTENTQLPFIYKAEVTAADRKLATDTLKKVGLENRMKHKPNELSGGQQQRVAVARALSNQPLVILADEPTGNLDSKSALEIMGIFKELHSQGKTIIMVTHEPNLAEQASRIITMRDGKIISDKKSSEPVSSQEIKFSTNDKKRNIFSIAEFKNFVYESLLSLMANKLRSFLSILGVLIGVSAVVAMLAIGGGAKQQVQAALSSLGTNLLMVRTSSRSGGISLGADTVTRFTFADEAEIKRLPGVQTVVPYVTGRVQMVYKSHNWNTSVYGVTSQYQYVHNSVPASGNFFSDTETVLKAKVVVLGSEVAKQLFADEDPIGKQVLINRINFIVTGVLPVKGISGFRNQDDQIFIPVTTAMYRVLGQEYISYFDVQATDPDSADALETQIQDLIVRIHRIPPSQAESIDIRNMADIQKIQTDTANTFSYLLGAIAAVSLLVGGIGIMNIMLVTVMERTHEIGLRKALGAQNYDIMVQFVVEAVLVCGIGGLMGVLMGIFISTMVSVIAGWNVYVSVMSITLSFVFSLLIGIIFGLWPALKAAKMPPIVALRYE